MTPARRLRPSWRAMGLWKWPAIGLVFFYLAIVPFYVQRAGSGVARLGSWVADGTLGGCAVRIGTTTLDGALLVRLRVDPGCAPHLAQMTVTAAGPDGRSAEKPVRGNPNTRAARLTIPPASVETLILAARTAEGAPVQQRWTPTTP